MGQMTESPQPLKVCIIQTAFPGDVILALGLVETIYQLNDLGQPVEISLVIRKGNEFLVDGHPKLKQVYSWVKKGGKLINLIKLGILLRKERFDVVINVQRFFSTGLLTLFAGARQSACFAKNPLSSAFTHALDHFFKAGWHETDRNHALVQAIWPTLPKQQPRLYPSAADQEAVQPYKTTKYICIAPGSVWATKTLPASKWAELVNAVPQELSIYFLGGPAERSMADEIKQATGRGENLCGQLGFLASAALMAEATMNYTCDSAPLHLAGAVNAPLTAVYCSTSPDFGFGPMHLTDRKDVRIIETKEKLNCRPCGLHGKSTCPEGHFRCALTITQEQLVAPLVSR